MSAAELFAPDFKEKPYWWEAAEPALRPGRALPARVEVAVVGGGYTGLSAALELARRGREVCVLDGERIGFGASSRNGGMVSGGLKIAKSSLAERFGQEKAREIIDEGARSFTFLEELIAREKIECHYKRTGRYLAAYSPKHYAELGERAKLLRETTGMATALVPRERQREEIGSDHYRGGLVVEAAGGLHPALYVRGLAAAAERAGAALIDETRVGRISRNGDGFEIATNRGRLSARTVMLGTNGYTERSMPWFARRLIPVASFIIATEPLAPEVTKRLVPNGRMISDTRRVLNYFRLSPDGTRVLWGGRASFRRVDQRTSALRLHATMSTVWPELKDVRITHSWTGNVAFTFDFLPHMGVHDGIYYALGCQGSGVAMQSYLGYRTALKIVGGDNRPCAFDGLPFNTLPLYNGQPWFLPLVGSWYRLRDRLDRMAA
jgi:glycine/D-amino acid oxidase-like deaminating enzyme